MSSLFELTKNQLELKANLMAMDFDEITIADTLEGSSLEIQEKIEGYGFVILDEESFDVAMTDAIDRMIERRQERRNRLEKLKERLLAGMMACEINKVETSHFTISVQNNPPSVEIYNDKLISAEFMRTPQPKPTVAAPDKKLILEKLKAGEDVDGCKMVQKVRLVIR